MSTQKLVSECSPQFYSQKLQEETQMPINRWISKTWYIHTIEYYSAMKRNAFELVLMRWRNLEPIIQCEVKSERKTNIVY